MTTTRHVPAFLHALAPQTPRVARAVQASHDRELALAADCALLDYPSGRFNLDLIDTTGTYSFSYVRNPGARYLRLDFRVNAVAYASYGTSQVQCDLTVRDAAGHSVASSDDRIPYGYKNEVTLAPQRTIDGPILAGQTLVAGVLDCNALDDTLTDPSWVFEFAFTFAGGAEVNSVQGQEIPRFVIDDSAPHGGVIPGNLQRDAPLDDDPVERLGRVLATLESARAVERTYVSLAWRQQVIVTTETPNVTATSYTEFTALSAGAGTAPQTWRPSPRQVYAGSSAGEAIRFRFLYRFSGGAGSETAQVQLTGNATGSPWASGSLTYTTSWTWSPWITAAIRTSPLADTLALKGKVSASGPLLWIASIHVLEAVS